jgi:hypothetical protein
MLKTTTEKMDQTERGEIPNLFVKDLKKIVFDYCVNDISKINFFKLKESMNEQNIPISIVVFRHDMLCLSVIQPYWVEDLDYNNDKIKLTIHPDTPLRNEDIMINEQTSVELSIILLNRHGITGKQYSVEKENEIYHVSIFNIEPIRYSDIFLPEVEYFDIYQNIFFTEEDFDKNIYNITYKCDEIKKIKEKII